MRILKCAKLKWNYKSLIAYIITLILAIMCGVVLYKLNKYSVYAYNFADFYVFYIFNFNNWSLFLAHFMRDIFYLYLIFVICYFTKFKFLAYPIFFVRCLFTVLYTIILFALLGTEGAISALIVFIPSSLCSIALCIFFGDQSKELCTPFAFICPAVLALINSVILMLLVNVVFRVIVVIV